MPCLVQYKGNVRKDFFGDLPGVVGVHGEPWREFRSRVQKPVLQLATVRRYVRPLEEVTDYFIERCQDMLDENQELPDDFDNEIHKWSLECKSRIIRYIPVIQLVAFCAFAFRPLMESLALKINDFYA